MKLSSHYNSIKKSSVMANHRYTTEQVRFLKELYTREYYTLKELTAEFNKKYKVSLTSQKIKAVLGRHGFKSKNKCGMRKGQYHSGSFKDGNKPLQNSGQFQKGHIPHNKG